MTEEEANKKLFENESLYLKPINGIKAIYCSVVKKSNNFELKNDYAIEIGYVTGAPRRVESIYALLEKVEIDKTLNDEIIKGIVIPKETDEVYFENKKTEIVCKDIFDICSKRYSFLTGGISVRWQKSLSGSGTAGAFFKMKDSQEDIFMISNHHVLARYRNRLGTKIVHPSKADALKNSYKITENIIGSLYWSKLNDTLDAAIAKIDLTKKNVKVAIGRYTRCNHLKIKGIKEAKIGDNISKCGRTTGLTFGEIISTNATVVVKDEYSRQESLFRNQIQYTCMTDSGDSGSLIVNENDFAIGLHFAGNKINASFSNKLSLIFGSNFPNLNFHKFL